MSDITFSMQRGKIASTGWDRTVSRQGKLFILKLGRAQHEYFVESLEKCAEFTVNYYDVLRKCFRHYCKINHTGTNVVMGGACMSYTAWESLLTDIRVLGYDSIKKLSAKR